MVLNDEHFTYSTEIYDSILNESDLETKIDEMIKSGSQLTDLAMIGCHFGNLDIIKYILTKNINIDDIYDNHNNGLLHYASINSHLDIVNYILELGDDPDILNLNEKTPLWLAAKYNNNEIINMLLDYGADPDVENLNGKSPLWIASKRGNEEVVDTLINYGVNMEISDNKHNMNPLLIATHKNQVNIVKKLYGYYNNVSKDVCLYMTVYNGSIDILMFLIEININLNSMIPLTHEYCNINVPIIIIAAQEGQYNCLKLLLDNNANIDKQASNGTTAIFQATINNHINIIELLLDNNANMDLHIHVDGMTPLLMAINNDNSELIELFIKYNCNLNKSTSNGISPLMMTVIKKNMKLIELLVETTKININTLTDDGLNALYYATLSSNYDKEISFTITNYLINKGADPNGCTNIKKYPLKGSIKSNNYNIFKLLVENGANINVFDIIKSACKKGNSSIVEYIYNHDNNCINLVDLKGKTPLYYATKYNNTEIVIFLTNLDVDINIEIDKYTSLLHIATENKNMILIKLFLELGLSINIIDINGYFPLYIICQLYKKDDITEEIFEFFITHPDIDIDMLTYRERSCMFAAVKTNNLDIIHRLESLGLSILHTDMDNINLLHIAAADNNLELMKYFIDTKSMDVNIMDSYSSSTLFIAVINEYIDMIKYLIELPDININLKNQYGVTVIWEAIVNNNIEIVELLLNKNANISFTSDDGISPLYLAIELGELDIVNLLYNKTVCRSIKTVYRPDNDCIICTDKIEENSKMILIGHCGHIYHHECLTTWYNNKPSLIDTCPKCGNI